MKTNTCKTDFSRQSRAHTSGYIKTFSSNIGQQKALLSQGTLKRTVSSSLPNNTVKTKWSKDWKPIYPLGLKQ